MSVINNLYNSIIAVFSKKQRTEYDEMLLGLGISDEVSKELAFMVVLVSLATIDNNFHYNEYSYIFSEMSKRFKLSHDQIQSSIKQVEVMIASKGGTQFIFDHMRNTFSKEDRLQLMEMVQGLIKADSVIDGFEAYLTQTFRKQLGLDDGHDVTLGKDI